MENLIVIIVSCIAGGVIAGLVLGYYLCGREYKVQIAQLLENQQREIINVNNHWASTLVDYETEWKRLDTKREIPLQVIGTIPEIWGQAIQEDIEEPNGLDKFLEEREDKLNITDHRQTYGSC